MHVTKIQNPNSLRLARTIGDTPAVYLYLRPTGRTSLPLRRRFQLLSFPTTCSNPSLHLRQRFRPLSLPVTSGHPSSATFRGVSVARHLRPSLFGNVSALYRCPSPPPIHLRRCFQLLSFPTTCSNPSLHLRRRFRPLSSPVTSGHPSPATFPAVSVARHLRPSLFGDVSSSYRSQPPARIPPSIFGNVFALYRCPSPPASLFGDVSERFRRPPPPAIHLRQFLGEITVISISFAILRGFFIRVDPLICN